MEQIKIKWDNSSSKASQMNNKQKNKEIIKYLQFILTVALAPKGAFLILP